MTDLHFNIDEQVTFLLENAKGLDRKILNVSELKEIDYITGIKEVIKFLNLISGYQQKLTPSLIVDLIWHELILFTECYTNFCQKYYSKYIHHHPGGDESSNQRQYQQTLKLLTLTYGQNSDHFWPGSHKINHQCGSCS